MIKKRRAVHAELRKQSQAFDGWLKYEITIENTDGSIEKVPAYGKDLQDALSRVVHDERVEKIESKIIKKVPEAGWAIAWILGLSLIVTSMYYNFTEKYIGVYLVGAIIAYAFATLSVSNWFNLRNRINK